MNLSLNRCLVALRVLCALGVACSLSTTAAAQQQEPRSPYAGLFGAGADDRTQTLDVRAAIFGAVDDNVLAQLPGVSGADPLLFDPRNQKKGMASGLNGSVGYRINTRGERSQFELSADSVFSEFSTVFSGTDTPRLWAAASRARTRVSADFTPKTTLAFSAGAAHSPFYENAPFLTDGNEATPVSRRQGLFVASQWVGGVDASSSMTSRRSTRTTLSAAVGWRKAQDGNLQPAVFVNLEANPVSGDSPLPALTPAWVSTSDAAASLKNHFSKRSSISVEVAWRSAEQNTGDQRASLETRNAQVVLAHNLTQALVVRGGFGIGARRYSVGGDSPASVYPTMELGLGYGDGLALTRRLTLSLSTQTSVVRSGEFTTVGADGETHKPAVRVDGAATLTRTIGRTWSTSAGYSRGTSYIAGFDEPIFYDSANGDVGGQVVPRLRLSAGASYSRGRFAFAAADGLLTRYTASSRLTYGLGPHVGLYGQYAHHIYHIASHLTAINLTPSLQRRSLSFGVSSWLPVLAAGKGSRDTQ